MNGALASPPIPPLDLRRITAAPDESTFLAEGIDDITLFLRLYERYAFDRPARPRVLDLGCGCGRLTRYLDGNDSYETSACDLNPDHVAWCRANLPRVRTRRNLPVPPLPFRRAEFDLVYALSVMTHLSERRALAWIADIARVLAPSGIAIITTHGYPTLTTMIGSSPHREMMAITLEETESIKAALPTTGYAYIPYTPYVTKMAKAGSDYGISFTDPEHVKRTWRAFLRPIAHIEGALRGWQDVFVLKA